MTVHRYPRNEDRLDEHTETMTCPCCPFVDFEIEGPNRQVGWVIKHSRLAKWVA